VRALKRAVSYTAMTGMKSAATLPPKPTSLKSSPLNSAPLKASFTSLRPELRQATPASHGGSADRERLLQKAAALEPDARNAAERGDIAASARLILDALDLERRAGGLGPQVLQLIKPR